MLWLMIIMPAVGQGAWGYNCKVPCKYGANYYHTNSFISMANGGTGGEGKILKSY